MKRIVLTFGLISGAISGGMIFATAPFADKLGEAAEWLGYTTLVLAFLLVYFGIRAYRDHVLDGTIGFLRALGVGTLITVISSLCYVATWEIAYFTFEHNFMDKYTVSVLAQAKASGATPAQLQQKSVEMQQYKAMYENPLYNSAITFLEPFPVGMVITIVSAFALSRRRVVQATT